MTPEVDQVDRHLGVLDLSESSPEPLRHDPFWWCVLRNLWNSSWNIATISALRGPRSRQRTSTSSQVHRLLEIPALRLGVELAREGIVELPHVLAVAHLLVRRDLDADLLAVGHDRREPPLAQLVVGRGP